MASWPTARRFCTGMVGWDATHEFASDDFVDQIAQALRNVVDVLCAAHAGPEHLVRMTWFIIDKRAYLSRQQEIGAVYRAIISRHFPAMSVVVVAGLIEDRAMVEIGAAAMVPRDPDAALRQ